MKTPYAFIGNYYHQNNILLKCKNSTYVPYSIDISMYTNNHKSQRNLIPYTITHSIARTHHAIIGNCKILQLDYSFCFLFVNTGIDSNRQICYHK
jgi:hypothetical protein